MSWDCPENNPTSQRGQNRGEAQEENVVAVIHEETLEVGESLLMKGILIKSETEVK